MFSRRRFTMTLAAGTVALQAHDEYATDPALDRVALIHGGTGPFAVAGYRMGAAALKQLKLNRGSFDLEVIHHAPRPVELYRRWIASRHRCQSRQAESVARRVAIGQGLQRRSKSKDGAGGAARTDARIREGQSESSDGQSRGGRSPVDCGAGEADFPYGEVELGKW